MPRKPKPATAAETPPPATVVAYKGFSLDWKCRDFQYAVGQTYTHDGDVVRCAAGGFHSCEVPFDVWNYYPLGTSRFAEVEVGGKIDRAENQDSKIASAQITIRAELTLPEFIKRGVAWIVQAAKGNTATGDSGHAAATGKWGIAAALGPNATAKAGADGWLVLAHWAWTKNGYELRQVRSAKVGTEGIEAGVPYRLDEDGAFIRVEAV